MKGPTISINGALCGAADASISVLDRGFLYGDSVYEVVRTYGGRPFAMHEHLERLRRSAALIEMALPVALDTLSSDIEAAIAAARDIDDRASGAAEFYVRLIVTRGSGAITLDPAAAVDPTRIIIVTPLTPPDAALYEAGVKVLLIEASAGQRGLPGGVKSGNYLANVLALRRARQQGGDEAVMLAPAGQIAEGASSNVFVVKNRRVITPPLDVGILEGITRRYVLSVAQEAGYEVIEATLWPDDLNHADEVFLTGTIREIMPVVTVNDWTIGSGEPGPVTRALREAFRAAVSEGAR